MHLSAAEATAITFGQFDGIPEGRYGASPVARCFSPRRELSRAG